MSETKAIIENKEFKKIDKEELKGRLEAVIFASGEPILIKDLAIFLNVVPDSIETLIMEMEEEYDRKNRGIRLIRLDDRVQLATKQEYSESVKKLAKVNERQTLSQGALESLAIIAYRQPVTRAEIDEIRGVSSEYVLQKLVERDIIKVVGRKDAPGKPRLYATTDEFLVQFGINDLKNFKNNPDYKNLIGLNGDTSTDIILNDEDTEDVQQISINEIITEE